ncbi:XTP/dITP diphosphatase [Thermoproteota archaeon]
MNKGPKIHFVTGNPNKFNEANRIFSNYHIELKMVKSKKFEIQNNDITTIAATSLKEVQKRISGPIIVEDSGLYISSLNGFPGPYSAYVYETLGCKGILKLLEGQMNREAEFRSAVAYTENTITSNIKIFLGIAKGKISEKMCGKQGFGFDSIFLPIQMDKTFGEIGMDEKNKYSHRAIAINDFASWYLNKK